MLVANIGNINPGILQDLKEQVIRTARVMFESGLIKSTFGVVSVRIPNTNYVIITPSGFSKAQVATENLCIVDFDGKLIQGKFRPSSETSMHVYIHKRLHDANAVLHTHSPATTAFAIAQKEIPCVSTEQGFTFGTRIPLVAEYFCPGTQDTSKLESIVTALRKTKAALLRNHGVIIIGCDLEEALDNAIVVEDIATTVLYSCILGGFPSELTPEEIEEVRKFRLTRYGQNASY
jgi:L-ribulose-5-phosphate 4-epimerase